MSKTVRGLVGAALLALGTLGGTGAVRACDAPACEYKTVIVYETRVVPYTATVVRYDDYGCPVKVDVTAYYKVQVPVKKVVRVYE